MIRHENTSNRVPGFVFRTKVFDSAKCLQIGENRFLIEAANRDKVSNRETVSEPDGNAWGSSHDSVGL